VSKTSVFARIIFSSAAQLLLSAACCVKLTALFFMRCPEEITSKLIAEWQHHSFHLEVTFHAKFSWYR
jgi:hypothetical protein